MLEEIIKEIRAAEDKAEEIKRNAVLEARGFILDAEAETAQVLQRQAAAAEAAQRELLAEAEKESQALMIPALQGAEREIDAMVAAARKKQEAATALVMERIVKTYGHS